ncbi:penicillin-binding protein 2 [Marinicauda salina]|uniref:Penicillin-binding protein 2 n=1 Tax=Marinicauda salina TaxID=2135793 RepID=A0A2U2BUP0_9PROT|nr:penicillin-binding protein 2 [Marinicauda salina]PWE17723.1 penicillin-binding protein 2 [Marinicauda salina]
MKLGFLRFLSRPRVSATEPPAPFQEAAPADVTRLLRLEDEAGAAVATSRTRLSVLGLVIGMGFALVALRAAGLALTAEPHVGDGPARVAAGEVSRGPILDRDGEILATNLDFHSLYADPEMVWDPVETAEQLSTVLTDLDVERTARDLASNRRFVWIRRGLSPRQRQAIHLLGLPGLGFRVEPGRIYPKQRAAAHVVGYADRDLSGLAGAERAFDSELAEDGGRPVALSIDLTAQHAVESVLRARMARYRAQGASAILMRVGTGEILALASLPDYDPNRVGEADPAALFNRATEGVYELGSVFKPLTLAAGLETGSVDLDDVFDATEPLRVGGHRIHDFHPERRPLTAREAIVHSSNIATARIADQIGRDGLVDFYGRLRLWERAPVELAESGEPLTPDRWGRIQLMTASFGHGFNVSPLALTSAYAALANGGVYTPPTLRPVAPGETVAGDPVMSASTAAQVLGVMRQVVTEGSGGQADVEGFAIAGKTGTAEQVVDGRYDPDSLITSFVSVFPFDDPQYVLLVTLDRPQPTQETHGFATAGWNAAPTAGEIIERLGGILDIERRELDPEARASVVAAMFAPRARTRAGPEEPVDLAAAHPAASAEETAQP